MPPTDEADRIRIVKQWQEQLLNLLLQAPEDRWAGTGHSLALDKPARATNMLSFISPRHLHREVLTASLASIVDKASRQEPLFARVFRKHHWDPQRREFFNVVCPESARVHHVARFAQSRLTPTPQTPPRLRTWTPWSATSWLLLTNSLQRPAQAARAAFVPSALLLLVGGADLPFPKPSSSLLTRLIKTRTSPSVSSLCATALAPSWPSARGVCTVSSGRGGGRRREGEGGRERGSVCVCVS